MKYDIHDKRDYRKFRFALGKTGASQLLIIGVNPSKANKFNSDRTMDKVEKLAALWRFRRQCFNGFVMLNLCPLRSVHPRCLPTKPKKSLHKHNLEIVRSHFKTQIPAIVWVAWGNGIDCHCYLLTCLKEIAESGFADRVKWCCCGKLTGKGNPRHPNPREKFETTLQRKLVPFDMKKYLVNKLGNKGHYSNAPE